MERNKHTKITNKLTKKRLTLQWYRKIKIRKSSTDVNKHDIDNVVNAMKYIYR